MIRCEHIDKSFDGKLVLDDITADFDRGVVNMIIGRSGSGKTVLIKCIAGLFEPDGGEIYYGGQPYTKLPAEKKTEIRRELGMIFQGGALFDSLTVEENVRFPMDMFTRQSGTAKRERVQACLERVNMSEAAGLYPSELSGGMIKRAAIARAIVLNPRYLLCDEPTSGLDPMTADVIDKLIREITEEYGMTTIINTHDLNSVMEIGEKIIFIHEGRKWWEGKSSGIMTSDNKELNEFIFASGMARHYKRALECK